MDTRKTCKNCGHALIWVEDGKDEQWMHGFIELGNWIDNGGSQICCEKYCSEDIESQRNRARVETEFMKDILPIKKKYGRIGDLELYVSFRTYCNCNRPEPYKKP